MAARRGSPLLVGVKSAKKLKVDFVDVDMEVEPKVEVEQFLTPGGQSRMRRTESRSYIQDVDSPQPIEYILASDASAIIEHTKQVLYLEDDDIAHIADGGNHNTHITHLFTFHVSSLDRLSSLYTSAPFMSSISHNVNHI